MLESNKNRLVSINTGEVRELEFEGTVHRTGISKRPLSGAVRINIDGVAGDEIANPEFHGGADQAVYAYGLSDYDWWHAETGRSLQPGQFGENLTIAGLPTHLSIGDRLLIGTVVLEATGPRIPCAKLGAAMQDSRFPFRFQQAERPGCYFRVLSPGQVSTGDVVDFIEVDGDTPPVSTLEVQRLYYDKQATADRLERALETPLASRLREKFSRRLERLQA